MFVIVAYDVNVKRNNKVLKICRKYLSHVQKSVFEGIITEAKLKKLKNEIAQVINRDEDSVMIYRFETLKYSSKEVIGVHETDSNFLWKTNRDGEKWLLKANFSPSLLVCATTSSLKNIHFYFPLFAYFYIHIYNSGKKVCRPKKACLWGMSYKKGRKRTKIIRKRSNLDEKIRRPMDWNGRLRENN